MERTAMNAMMSMTMRMCSCTMRMFCCDVSKTLSALSAGQNRSVMG